jgi:hypothetical protein
MEEDKHRSGHRSHGAEEVGHWPGHLSRAALGVGDAGGRESGGRSGGLRTGANRGIGVRGVAVAVEAEAR